jgi:periplasmic protein TonB
MDNTKAISIQNVAVWLVAAFLISSGIYVVKHNLIMSRSTPVFMGEELSVVRQAAAPVQVKVQAEPVTIVEAPVQPAIATALPIVPPAITYQVIPEYPAQLLEQGLSGTTVLSIYVGLAGNAEKVAVKSSSGVAEFDSAAVKAAELWRFTPASQGGSALASCFELPVRFEVK